MNDKVKWITYNFQYALECNKLRHWNCMMTTDRWLFFFVISNAKRSAVLINKLLEFYSNNKILTIHWLKQQIVWININWNCFNMFRLYRRSEFMVLAGLYLYCSRWQQAKIHLTAKFVRIFAFEYSSMIFRSLQCNYTDSCSVWIFFFLNDFFRL